MKTIILAICLLLTGCVAYTPYPVRVETRPMVVSPVYPPYPNVPYYYPPMVLPPLIVNPHYNNYPYTPHYRPWGTK